MPFPKFDNDKPLSKASKKIYRTYLNRLYSFQIADDISMLKDNAKYITAAIEEHGKSHQDKRAWMSAIFWALYEYPLEEKKHYYNYFQTLKTNVDKAVIPLTD